MGRTTRVPTWLILGSLLMVVSLLMTPVEDVAGKKRRKRPPAEQATGWELVFEDDFNGQTLNEGRWATQFPWGRDRSSVGELQYYAPDAFSVDNGKLNIHAKPTSNGNHEYDSGLISSHNSFSPEYGRFEIRCKVPQGQGLWPAFWLLPLDTSWPPEIDVFEILGQETDRVHLTAHWSENGEHRQKGTEYAGPDFSEAFHTFSVEWSPDKMVWYVDGVKRHEVTGKSPSGPMYLLANMAVGGPWPGAPDANTPFPATFTIDYIRGYASAPAPTVSETSRKSGKKRKARKKKRHNRKRHRRTAAGGRKR